MPNMRNLGGYGYSDEDLHDLSWGYRPKSRPALALPRPCAKPTFCAARKRGRRRDTYLGETWVLALPARPTPMRCVT